MTDSTPLILGKYKLLSQIGQGGMAKVYKGHDPGLDRQIAIKVMHIGSSAQSDFIIRFRREAKAVARLRHPNIIQVYDFDTQDDMHYLVMELIDGPTLEEEMRNRSARKKGFALAEINAIFKQLATAVDYAHVRGIIHRDLKPSNIMFRSDGHVVLTDFGIARLTDLPEMTKSGALIGTLNYMSPEQCQGNSIDNRSDIYSLGVILYELLAGRLPFISEQAAGLLYKHIHEPPPRLSSFDPTFPINVERVVLRSLNKNPDQRYQSVLDMAEALQHAIDSIEEASKSKEMGKPSPVFDTAPPDVATQRFTRAKASSAGSILGISAELLNELRDTLLDCGPFDTAHELNALFVNARLIPWRNRLPEANNPLERVEITIDFLNAQSNEEGENALILFLKVLIDRMNRQDQCWHKLNALVRALETDETAPQPNGDSEFDVNEVSITVYHEPGVFESPDQLFGREALIAELRPMLEKYQNLLFQGLGGSGKTALAATIADYLLDESNHPVIWIHVGHEDYDTVVDALVDELVEDQEERQEIRSAEGRNKSIMLRNMLRRSNSHLLVLDDVWVADVLQLLRIVPRNMGVIVTSRFRFPRLHIIDVVDLLPNDAVKLLIHYSGIQDLDQDPHALQLCKTLGYHAYALEIAGNILRVDDLTPEQLTAVIKDAPHHITMPDGGIEEGRESVAALLESSFELLSKREKSLFLTFGHLFAPGATFQLIYTFVALDEKDAQQSLNSLVRRGLIKRRYYKEEAIEFFTIHDLTFYFARGKAKQGEGMTIEERNSAVLQYLKVNVQEQMYNHLEVNLANILGAARNASKSSKEDFVRIMSWLCVGGYPRPEVFGYLEERGSTLPMLRLLDESSQAAKELELTEPLHYLWAKQGNIAIDRQEFSRAAEFYSKAAKISPNRERKVKLTSLVGKALSFYGDDERAEYFFKNAEDLADSNTLKEFVYGQQAHAAGQREDFIAAENFAFKQEMINRDILAQLGEDPTNHLEKEGALRGLFRALVNKGTARLRSGIGSPNEIIEIHNEARDIAIELENEEMLAHAHWALAEDNHALNQSLEAQIHISEAYKIYTQQGKTKDALEVRKFAEKHNYNVED